MIAMLNCKIRRIRVIITKDPSQQLTGNIAANINSCSSKVVHRRLYTEETLKSCSSFSLQKEKVGMREYGILFWQLSRKTPESLGILNSKRTGCATAAPFGRFCFQQSCVKAERKAIRNCGEGELYLTFLFLLYHNIKGNMNIAPNKIGYIYHASMDLHLLRI